MKTIVQFIHPGGEYEIDPNNLDYYLYDHNLNKGVLFWNKGDHRRKFLKSLGDYISKNNEKFGSQEVLFWGEWEAHSRFTLLNDSPANTRLPHHIHEPIYCMEIVGNQNTDPFVFGDCFYYSNCHQQQFRWMKNLDPGSIILFGTQIDKKPKSTADTKFVIDTVFVILKKIEYRIINGQVLDLQDKHIPQILYDCTLNRLPDGNCALYIGETIKSPKDGMFSYAPVKSFKENEEKGFEKVTFWTGSKHENHDNIYYLPELKIIDRNQGVEDIGMNVDILDFYERLKSKILDQGFCLGHHFNYPDHIDHIQPIQ